MSCYTQPSNANFAMYKLDNIYFKKTNTEKINLISELVSWGNYVIFDTETNGINNFGESLPFQIAAIKYRNGVEVNRMNIIMNIWDIPENILEMTWFLQEDIDHWISLEDWIIQFNQFVRWEKYIVAHNASFDVSIVNNALVKTGTYLWKDIQVLCSMQMYYTIYKHIFELGISWSSLDQLSHILLWINISNEDRHKADYDVLLVQELLEKMKADIEYDYSLENSRINRVLEIETKLKWKIARVSGVDYNTDFIINFVHNLGEDISNLFTEYYEDYFLRNIEIANAVSDFITERSGEDYPQIFLRDELNKLTYYIKKNRPFIVIDERYAKTWSKTSTKIYTDSGYEITFFRENPKHETDLVIDSEEALTFTIEEFVNNKNKMMKIQMHIQYLLKIIKAHRYKSNFSRYWDEWKWIYFKVTKELAKNERMIDVMNIKADIDSWYIKTLDDLYEVKDYNTTLLVEQNLSNLFNLD